MSVIKISGQGFFPANEVTFSTIEDGGIGYPVGYSSIYLFFPFKLDPNVYFFSDTRFHVFNDRRIAGNVGIGVRGKINVPDVEMGTNFFFDFRNSVTPYKRSGIGIDLAYRRLFVAANGYFLINQPDQTIKKDYYNYEDGYYIKEVFEENGFRYSFDAELGLFPIDIPQIRAYASAGPYFLNDNNLLAVEHNIWGVKARAFVEIQRVCHLEFVFSDDPFFGKKYQGKIAFSLAWPFEKRLNRKMQVVRQEIIPLTKVSYWRWNW